MISKLIRLLTHQRWLRFGLRDRLARWWHNPDMAVSDSFETEFYGYRYRGNFSTYIDWSVYYFGAYAESELILIKDILKPLAKPVVFDIGANVGHHSLFAASIADKVYSFEPFYEVADQLANKINENRINNIILHRFGLGSQNQILPFEAPKNCNTGTGKFVLGSVFSNRGSRQLALEVRRGDDVIHELALAKPDLIKIDVEGFEVEVLKGLRGTLKRFRPIVFFEWNQSEVGATIFHRYFPNDYQFFRFEPTPPFCGLFCRERYRLNSITSGNQDLLSELGSNYLAMPVGN